MFFGMDFSNSPLCPYFTHNLIIFCDILLLRSTLILLRLSHKYATKYMHNKKKNKKNWDG